MNLGDNNGSVPVSGSFAINAQLPDGMSINFSGYVLQGEGSLDLNMKVDMGMAMIKRQRLIAEVPILETKLKQLEEAKMQTTAILKDLASQSKLTTVQKQHEAAHKTNLEKINRDIVEGIEAVARAKHAAAEARGI
jgi:hypothetical protein